MDYQRDGSAPSDDVSAMAPEELAFFARMSYFSSKIPAGKDSPRERSLDGLLLPSCCRPMRVLSKRTGKGKPHVEPSTAGGNSIETGQGGVSDSSQIFD